MKIKEFFLKVLNHLIHSIPSPINVQTSLHGCLEPMSDMQHNSLQNDLISYGEHNSIMQMSGGPLSSNSSIVNM